MPARRHGIDLSRDPIGSVLLVSTPLAFSPLIGTLSNQVSIHLETIRFAADLTSQALQSADPARGVCLGRPRQTLKEQLVSVQYDALRFHLPERCFPARIGGRQISLLTRLHLRRVVGFLRVVRRRSSGRRTGRSRPLGTSSLPDTYTQCSDPAWVRPVRQRSVSSDDRLT